MLSGPKEQGQWSPCRPLDAERAAPQPCRGLVCVPDDLCGRPKPRTGSVTGFRNRVAAGVCTDELTWHRVGLPTTTGVTTGRENLECW